PACARQGSLLLTAPPAARFEARRLWSSHHEDLSSKSGDGALRRQTEARQRPRRARLGRALAQAHQRRKGARAGFEQEASAPPRHPRAREEGVREPDQARRFDSRAHETAKGRELARTAAGLSDSAPARSPHDDAPPIEGGRQERGTRREEGAQGEESAGGKEAPRKESRREEGPCQEEDRDESKSGVSEEEEGICQEEVVAPRVCGTDYSIRERSESASGATFLGRGARSASPAGARCASAQPRGPHEAPLNLAGA